MVVAFGDRSQAEVLDGYIQEELVRQESERLGFKASDDEIDSALQEQIAIASAPVDPWLAQARADGFSGTVEEYFAGPEYRALLGLTIAAGRYVDDLGPRSEVVDEEGHTRLDVKLGALRKKAKIVICR